MTWVKNHFWVLWAIVFGGFDLFAALYLLAAGNAVDKAIFYVICFFLVVPISLAAHFNTKKSRLLEAELEDRHLKSRLEEIREKYDE